MSFQISTTEKKEEETAGFGVALRLYNYAKEEEKQLFSCFVQAFPETMQMRERVKDPPFLFLR